MMTTIELLRIDPVNMPHAQGKIAVERFHKQVVVIVHQAVGIATPMEAFYHLFDQSRKLVMSPSFFKYRHPGASPRRNVIHGPGYSIRNGRAMSHGHTPLNVTLQDLTSALQDPGHMF